MRNIFLSLSLTFLLLTAWFGVVGPLHAEPPVVAIPPIADVQRPLRDEVELVAVNFSTSTYTLVETDTLVPITITLDRLALFTITVHLGIMPDSATLGEDYLSASRLLTFAPGITTQVVTLTVLADDVCETTEQVLLLLGRYPMEEGTYTLGVYETATLNIMNDDRCVVHLPALWRDWQAPPPSPITDTLRNPSFEEGYDHTTIYGEDPTILNPVGWATWWEHNPELGMYRPEVRPIPNEWPYNSAPNRIHSGNWAMQIFRGWSVYRAGFLQGVGDLPVGATTVFSTYAHAWACQDDPPPAYSCNGPYAFHFKVGIDSHGGADPFTDTIIWTDKHFVYDTYAVIGPVTATVGAEGMVTVFIYAEPTWKLKFVDAYIDDAALSVYPK